MPNALKRWEERVSKVRFSSEVQLLDIASMLTWVIESNDPNAKGFLDHFIEEIRDQFRGGPPSKQ